MGGRSDGWGPPSTWEVGHSSVSGGGGGSGKRCDCLKGGRAAGWIGGSELRLKGGGVAREGPCWAGAWRAAGGRSRSAFSPGQAGPVCKHGCLSRSLQGDDRNQTSLALPSLVLPISSARQIATASIGKMGNDFDTICLAGSLQK